MNNNLIHDDSMEPQTVTVHVFSILDRLWQEPIDNFRVKEIRKEGELESNFVFDEWESYPYFSLKEPTKDERWEVVGLAEGDYDGLVQLAIDLLSNDTTL